MFLMSGGYTMVVPFLPIYLRDLGAPEDMVAIWSGSVYTITFFVAGIMAPIWGKIADRYGAKMMVLRSCIGIGIAYFIAGLVTSPVQLLLVRGLQGFANGYIPAAMTLISKIVDDKEVGPSIGILQIGMIAGNITGPLLGGVMEHSIGIRPIFYIVGILMISTTFIIVKWVDTGKGALENAPPKTTIREDWRLVYENKHLLEILGIAFVVQAATLLIQPIIALYVGHLLGSKEHVGIVVGIILSMAGIVGAFMSRGWGSYGQRRGLYHAIIIGFIGSGTALFLQAFFENIWTFAFLQVFFTFFMVGFMPNISGAVTLATKAENRGRAFGILSTCQQMGNLVGPMMASIVMTYFGIFYVFFIASVTLFLVAFAMRRRYGPEVLQGKLSFEK